MHAETIAAILPPKTAVMAMFSKAIIVIVLDGDFFSKIIYEIIKTFGTQILVKIE